MKSQILLGLIIVTLSSYCHATNAKKHKVFTKPTGLDVQDLCARMPDGVLIADSEDCRLFYYCLNNEAEPVSCRTGYYFDQEKSYCIRGDCPASGPSTRCNKNEEFFTRIDGSCTAFNICHNGVLLHLECPVGTYFNDNKKSCVAVTNNVHHQCACIMPEYTALPNESNCHAYFMCAEGKAISQLCERGLFFNEHLNTCVPDVRGVCAVSANVTKNQKHEEHAETPQTPQKPIVHKQPHNNNQDILKQDTTNTKQKPETSEEHKKKPTKYNHVNKVQHTSNTASKEEDVSEAMKKAFLDDIREQLLVKKQQLLVAHQSHKEKVDIFEKCTEQYKAPPKKTHTNEYQNTKPITSEKDSNPESKPAHIQKPLSGSGVYQKLNSKFLIL